MSLDMNGELYLPSKKNTIKTRYCELYPHVLMEFEKKHLQKPKSINIKKLFRNYLFIRINSRGKSRLCKLKIWI